VQLRCNNKKSRRRPTGKDYITATIPAQSTAHEPPEDSRKYGPKHVGATEIKCF